MNFAEKLVNTLKEKCCEMGYNNSGWYSIAEIEKIAKEIEKMDKKKWTITFSNGYCGCDIEEEFDGTYEEAVAWANEYIPDYAEQYAYVAFGWDGEYTEEEYDDYVADCGYHIAESEEG